MLHCDLSGPRASQSLCCQGCKIFGLNCGSSRPFLVALEVPSWDAIALRCSVAKNEQAVVWGGTGQLSDSCRCLFTAIEFERVGITTGLAGVWSGRTAHPSVLCGYLCFELSRTCVLWSRVQGHHGWAGTGQRSQAHLVSVPCLSCDVLTLQRSGTIGLDHRISWEHNYINALQMLKKLLKLPCLLTHLGCFRLGFQQAPSSGVLGAELQRLSVQQLCWSLKCGVNLFKAKFNWLPWVPIAI